jgi:Xaa-Pro aminopeptidase
MYKEKTSQAVEILKEFGIDLWLTFVRETHTLHDPSLDFLCPSALTWQSALIISSDGEKIAIVGNLDLAAVKEAGIYDQVIAYKNDIKPELTGILSKKNPKKIAINYSRDSEMSDGLTYGMYLQLNDYLKDTGLCKNFISAESIISALRGRKTPEEARRLRKAAKYTQKIFDGVTGYMKPGMTEKQVADFILARLKEMCLEPSWDVSTCPSVFTGPDTAGAHFGPTGRKIEPGHILNIDFGVKYDSYVSDMQRTWYFLRPGEKEPPEEVKKGFNVLLGSIKAASVAIQPGIQGKDIDTVARQYIVNNGYEEFPHALGHQLGRAAHDGHGLLCPEWERYGERPYVKIEKGQVYTIEPRLTVKDHGVVTIEEEVIVTENGCEYLSEPQTELYVIG